MKTPDRDGPRTAATASSTTLTQPGTQASAYRRQRDLPSLLPLWPSELKIASEADHLRLLARLRRALRVERQRGLSGHWTYDLARHAQLLRAYRIETALYLAARAESVPDATGSELR